MHGQPNIKKMFGNNSVCFIVIRRNWTWLWHYFRLEINKIKVIKFVYKCIWLSSQWLPTNSLSCNLSKFWFALQFFLVVCSGTVGNASEFTWVCVEASQSLTLQVEMYWVQSKYNFCLRHISMYSERRHLSVCSRLFSADIFLFSHFP